MSEHTAVAENLDPEPSWLVTRYSSASRTLLIAGNEAGLKELWGQLGGLIQEGLDGSHFPLDRGINMRDSDTSLIVQRGSFPHRELAAEEIGDEFLLPTDIPAEVIELVNSGNPLKAIMRYRELHGLTLLRARQVVSALNRVRQTGIRLSLPHNDDQ